MQGIVARVKRHLSYRSERFYARELIIELTNRCNLRCRRCNIWKERPKRDFGLEKFRELLQSDSLRYVESIVLSGGEPFVLDDIGAYAALVRTLHPDAYINISTNGYAKDRILSFLDAFGTERLSLSISFDGLGFQDRVRGKKGSEREILSLVDILRTDYPRLKFDIKFLLGDMNSKALLPTAKYFRERKVRFNIKVVEAKNNYQTRSKGCKDQLTDLSALSSIRGINDSYLSGIISQKKGEPFRCRWPKRRLFILSNHDVYLCYKLDPIGNLDEGLEHIISGRKLRSRMKEMESCRDRECHAYLEK